MFSWLQRLFFQKLKRVWTTVFTFLVILLLDHYAPSRHLPWKPLNLDEPIGFATGVKVRIISLMPRDLCFEKLASAKQLSYEQVLPKIEGECGWKTAATIHEVSNIKFKPKEVTAQCPVLLASYIWLKDIDKAAWKRLEVGLNIYIMQVPILAAANEEILQAHGLSTPLLMRGTLLGLSYMMDRLFLY